jgi:hypothetical protein
VIWEVLSRVALAVFGKDAIAVTMPHRHLLALLNRE